MALTGTMVFLSSACGTFISLFAAKLFCSGSDLPPIFDQDGIISEDSKLSERQLCLNQVSNLWIADRQKSMYLKEMAPLWRNLPLVENGEVRQTPSFLNQDVIDFYNEHVKNQEVFIGAYHNSVIQCLSFLDGKARCPSVVSKFAGNKPDPKKESDA